MRYSRGPVLREMVELVAVRLLHFMDDFLRKVRTETDGVLNALPGQRCAWWVVETPTRARDDPFRAAPGLPVVAMGGSDTAELVCVTDMPLEEIQALFQFFISRELASLGEHGERMHRMERGHAQHPDDCLALRMSHLDLVTTTMENRRLCLSEIGAIVVSVDDYVCHLHRNMADRLLLREMYHGRAASVQVTATCLVQWQRMLANVEFLDLVATAGLVDVSAFLENVPQEYGDYMMEMWEEYRIHVLGEDVLYDFDDVVDGEGSFINLDVHHTDYINHSNRVNGSYTDDEEDSDDNDEEDFDEEQEDDDEDLGLDDDTDDFEFDDESSLLSDQSGSIDSGIDMSTPIYNNYININGELEDGSHSQNSPWSQTSSDTLVGDSIEPQPAVTASTVVEVSKMPN